MNTSSPALLSGPAEIAPTARRRLVLGFTWAALSVVLFSGWFVVTRFSVVQHLRVWDIMALRFGGGALVLGPLVLRPGGRLPARGWRAGFLFSLLWGTPFVLCIALGLKLSSASEASAITPALMPVFAGLIGWAVLREAPGRVRLLGFTVIVAGLVALLASKPTAEGAVSPLGIAVLMGAACMWAIYTLRFRRSGLTPLQSAAAICLWSSALYLPFYLGLGLSRLGEIGLAELAVQAFYQGILMSCVAVVSFNRAVTLLGPVAAAPIIALIPVSATLIAIPALGEVPTTGASLAIAVIALGVIFAARPTPQAHKKPTRSAV